MLDAVGEGVGAGPADLTGEHQAAGVEDGDDGGGAEDVPVAERVEEPLGGGVAPGRRPAYRLPDQRGGVRLGPKSEAKRS
ncbi:hypothetical protein GCM10023177_65860 [Streptomyces violaceoruber]